MLQEKIFKKSFNHWKTTHCKVFQWFRENQIKANKDKFHFREQQKHLQNR